MVKEKQKKSSAIGGPFIGFSAFATTPSGSSNVSDTSSSKVLSSSACLRPSPVYISSCEDDDTIIRFALARLRKKDAITKCKGFESLLQSCFPANNKKEAIAVSSHYAFLFHTIYGASEEGAYPHNGCLIYDNNHSVRLHSLQLWSKAIHVIPKAALAFLLYSDKNTTATTTTTSAIGAIYCSRHDPSREVSTVATSIIQKLMTTQQQQTTTLISNSIVSHIIAILSILKTPSKNNNNDDHRSYYEEQMERYERIVLSSIQATTTFLKTEGNDDFSPNTHTVLWKHLNNPHHDSFRNATYQLLSNCIQKNPLHMQSTQLETCFLTALYSEKNPSNTNLLLETVVLYTVRTNKSWWNACCKAACKQLRHACYGCSPASYYTQLVLPFIAASSPEDDEEESTTTSNKQLLLTSLYDGHMCVYTQHDCTPIMIAVSECCAFSIKKQATTRSATTFFGDLFFKAFTWYLTYSTTATFDTNTDTIDLLASQLAKDYNTIAQSSRTNATQEWLRDKTTSTLVQLVAASDGGTASSSEWKTNVTRLLRVISETPTTSADIREQFYIPGLQSIFHSIIRTMKDSSPSAPTVVSTIIEDEGIETQQQQQQQQQQHTTSEKTPSVIEIIALQNPIIAGATNAAEQPLLQQGAIATNVPQQVDLILFIEIINFCTVQQLFIDENDTAILSSLLKSFCIEDILQWTMHLGSTLSKYCDEIMVQSCFSLLLKALLAMDTMMRGQVWTFFLNELLVNNCQLVILSIGLDILSSSISCCTPVLDTFAIDVGIVAAANSNTNNDHDMELERFFKSCLGWKNEKSLTAHDDDSILVSNDVISKWISATCTSISHTHTNDDEEHEEDVSTSGGGGGGRNILLRLLITLACCQKKNKDFTIIKRENTVQLFLEAWYRCGDVWERSIWKKNDRIIVAVMYDVLDAAQRHLVNDLTRTATNDNTKRIARWARRGLKLIDLQEMLPRDDTTNTSSIAVRRRPLDLLGLGNSDVWKRFHNDDTMSQWYVSHLVAILEANNINNSTDNNYNNQVLVMGGKSVQDATLLVHIVKSCIIGASRRQSATSTTQLAVYHHPSINQAEKLLHLLGWIDGIGIEFLESCCDEIVSSLAEAIVYRHNSRKLGVLVQSLDLLCKLLLGTMQPYLKLKVDAIVNPFEVRTGDVFWYVLKDGGEDNTSRRARVIKIHDEDRPNPPYFTIRFLNDDDTATGTTTVITDSVEEKQTVSSRLRKSCPSSSSLVSSIALQQTVAIQRLERRIVEQIIRPVLSSEDVSSFSDDFLSMIAEFLNIVLYRFGLVGEVGVGSTRYDVFQFISNYQKSVIDAVLVQIGYYHGIESTSPNSSIASPQVRSIERELYFLALAMGGGVLTEPSSYNFEILRLDPTASINALCELYANKSWQDQRQQQLLLNSDEMNLELACAMWLAVATRAVIESETLVRISGAINDLASVIFRAEDWQKKEAKYRMKFSLTVMSALENLYQQGNDIGAVNLHSLAVSTVSSLIRCFLDVWDIYDNGDISNPWHGVFLLILRRGSSIRCLPTGARKYANKLCETLFLERKRWYGYQLLHMISVEGLAFEICDELSSRSQESFQMWSRTLPPEEVEELKEDMHLTSRVLPSSLMDEISTWDDGKEAELDDVIVVGRFLSWLVFLDLLDGFSKLDAKSRGAMISFAQHTRAGRYILSLSARYSSFQSYGKKNSDGKWMSCTSIEEDQSSLNSEQLATMVFFRSVQALPTVVKSWWNDDCHRSLQSMVSQFVEAQVSPETLRQELRRIKAAENLGDMQVTGSIVSREVTAVYEQDEMKLSVLIRVPTSFPLRNVEVDCHKTLGIPEKRWRRWALSIMTMLNNEDGSILDALLLWKENVDKEFEGIEPCPVCYSIICVKTHAMPNLECKTCHNRFHSSCLFKWFQSSGKNHCVLCQQPWSGHKVN